MREEGKGGGERARRERREERRRGEGEVERRERRGEIGKGEGRVDEGSRASETISSAVIVAGMVVVRRRVPSGRVWSCGRKGFGLLGFARETKEVILIGSFCVITCGIFSKTKNYITMNKTEE